MNNKNKLEYIANKFFCAAFSLANYSGTRGNALADLFDSPFLFMLKPGLEYQFVPEDLVEHFKTLETEMNILEKRLEKERLKLIEKFPSLKRDINAKTRMSTIAAKLRQGERTLNIINSICFIAFGLWALKDKDISDINFVSMID